VPEQCKTRTADTPARIKGKLTQNSKTTILYNQTNTTITLNYCQWCIRDCIRPRPRRGWNFDARPRLQKLRHREFKICGFWRKSRHSFTDYCFMDFVSKRKVLKCMLRTWSVKKVVCYELVCYERGLLWTWSVMNVVCHERGLLWTWSVMNVLCYERGLQWTWSAMNVVCNERGLQWTWSAMNVVCNERGCWMWSVMNVVCHEHGLSWTWSLMKVVCHEGGLSWRWSVMKVVCHESGLSWTWSVMKSVCHECAL